MVEVHQGQRGSGGPSHKQELLHVSFLTLCGSLILPTAHNLQHINILNESLGHRLPSGSRCLFCLIDEITLRLCIQLVVYGRPDYLPGIHRYTEYTE